MQQQTFKGPQRLVTKSVIVLVMSATLSFSGCAKRIPLPAHLKVADAAALVRKVKQSQQPNAELQRLSAEMRLTFMGPQGRRKGTASLVMARPDRFRYDIHGPHGGVLQAVATDGSQLYLLDLVGERFLSAPATAAAFDRLLQWAPMGLDAAGWTALLFGDVAIPPEAQLSYNDRIGRYVLSWSTTSSAVTTGPNQRSVFVDPATALVTAVRAWERGPDGKEVVIAHAEVMQRDARGVPKSMSLKAPQSDAQVRVRFRDVDHSPGFSNQVFVLRAPPGTTVETLQSLE